MRTGIVATLAAILTAGCCSTGVKSVPSSISLKDALVQVSDGINELQKDAKRPKAGLLLSDVDVTFNIAAGGTDSRELKLDLAPANVIKEVPSGSFGSSSTSTLTRSNSIVLKFRNIATISKDTVVGVSMAPHVLMPEKTTVTEANGKQTVTEKNPKLSQPMSFKDLNKWAEEGGYVLMTPPASDR